MLNSKTILFIFFIVTSCATIRDNDYQECDNQWHVKQPLEVFNTGEGSNIRVTVLDDSDLKPLRNVNVGFSRDIFSYKTNSEGVVKLDWSKATGSDTLYFRYVGFDQTSIPINGQKVDSAVVSINPCTTISSEKFTKKY